jgi:6-phosphofructokinase 1
MDRVLATRYGAYAVELIAQNKYGLMVRLEDGEVNSIPLKEVGGKLRTVPLDHALIDKARKMGVCFGEKGS